ncbi:hypothetical protein BB561_002714 [Smittium simulii]|uniref:U6 snRNA-associated Sm-like protein LSm1 n=1 Tax=Smittium simulii TaxID=133385 RepID=A0A2T9YPI7_9FUNG|nr:hypothetical protein BB561_002714 [Smittium simulii]
MDIARAPENYFTTTSCLKDLIDKSVYVSLRDGKNILGILRTFDQYGTVVIQDAIERVYVKDAFGDIERGIFLIRGENVIMLGELGAECNEKALAGINFRKLPIEQILELQRLEQEENQLKNKAFTNKLVALGFSVDNQDIYFN